MTPVTYDLDAIRTVFPSWSVFRSDAGAFYATRRGETLTDQQIDAGLQRTVCADGLANFVRLLQEQEGLR
ncbi:hypothetical protein [Planomonospora parontospora]|uniref:hypothetical protein n=1 Tax=Planomonospora parontospora TaxID=58119 RepID=UPI001670CB53|nr:hypothetical protein [Planomonospora parontospora]GGL27123.1 hypothetical protein GCM10014719_30830 [Planomonospora parontospora subsp. antibiotica]GII16560.1 hypothetical protein Ppa05_32860 [Planomonospora parontospora subsp. antibiotica]